MLCIGYGINLVHNYLYVIRTSRVWATGGILSTIWAQLWLVLLKIALVNNFLLHVRRSVFRNTQKDWRLHDIHNSNINCCSQITAGCSIAACMLLMHAC